MSALQKFKQDNKRLLEENEKLKKENENLRAGKPVNPDENLENKFLETAQGCAQFAKDAAFDAMARPLILAKIECALWEAYELGKASK